MISISPWFERIFRLDLEEEYFPLVLERLRGTPVRARNLVSSFDHDDLVNTSQEGWSPQEHAGHLLDLESLWLGRIDDVLNGETVMREADLTNRATFEASHNLKDIRTILDTFEAARNNLVYKLDGLDLESVGKSALHPRLRTPMRIIDLATFVAEHDDHHLATMRQQLTIRSSA